MRFMSFDLATLENEQGKFDFLEVQMRENKADKETQILRVPLEPLLNFLNERVTSK